MPLILEYRLFIFFAFTTMSLQPLAAQLVISEASNANTLLTDEDGDAPDWFELHNTGTEPVDLAGWTISDDPDLPAKWVLPAHRLPPGGLLKIWASGKDRRQITFFRTLIAQGDEFQYLLPDQSVGSSWITPGFDDTNWSSGQSGFGFGDNDDITTVPSTTNAVFLRHAFSLSDTATVQQLLFDVDYDDGFIAYLNGTEIARENLEGTAPVAYDVLAPLEREARLYRGGQPARFAIDRFRELLREGSNLLCLQIHNHHPLSRDLTAIPFLSLGYAEAKPEIGSTPPTVLQLGDRCWHTNFRISADGEALYLRNPAGIITDSLPVPSLPANTSYGRPRGNDDATVFFSVPTPGSPNPGAGPAAIVVNQAVFSHPGGITQAINLGISGAGTGETIRYSLDASEPVDTSPLYVGPLPLTASTVVRARIFREDALPGPITSRVFLFGVNHDLPIVSLISEPANFFGEERGIYVPGPNGESGPFPYFKANYWQDWERPLHFSLYETDGTPGTEFEAGVKIFGGNNRTLPQKSFSIFARKAYGTAEINYPLFASSPTLPYQSFVLRNSGNDWMKTMLRDAALTGLMADSGLDVQAYRPTVAYLNGRYWGIHNLREKVNEHFLAAKHGIDPADVNLLEEGGTVLHGNDAGFPDLIRYARDNDFQDNEHYQYVRQYVDLDNLIKYNVAQIYFGNTDWPHNNFKFWRPNNGKWRWILFDTDYGFGFWGADDYLDNSLNYALNARVENWPNQRYGNTILRELLDNEAFRHRFINQFADEMNQRFLPARVNVHLDTLSAAISGEIARHFSRWNGDDRQWAPALRRMRRFGEQRPEVIKGHLLDKFDLPAYHALSIDNPTPERGLVQVNSLRIEDADWTGDYFEGVPVPLAAIAREGYRFSHWEIGIDTTKAEISIALTEAQTFRPVFTAATGTNPGIVINEINYNSSDDFDPGDWIELHNASTAEVDLSGWIVRDEDDTHVFEFPEATRLRSGGFLIVAQKPADFRALFPAVTPVFGALGYGLGGGGDQVRIFDGSGQLRDSVAYEDDAPWPEAADGDGATLELIDPELDNVLASSWGIRNPSGGSPGRPNWLSNNDEVPGSANDQFKLYPNPSFGQLNLTFHLLSAQELTADLFDSRGKRMAGLFTLNFGAGEHTFTTEVADLPPGLYFVRLRGRNKVFGLRAWLKQ